MGRAPHKPVDDLHDIEEIINVYQKCGIPPGAVKTKEFLSVYKHFLEPQGADLVVYSDKYQDCIVYDSRTDKNVDLIKLTDKTVSLCLNNKHYDVVLNMRKFSKVNPSSFCAKCMSQFSSFEHIDTHICNSNLTCQKCFKQSKCLTNCKIQCSDCKIIFYNEECFSNHLTNRVFKAMQSNNGKIPPCQFFFVQHVTKLFRVLFFIK